MWRFIPVLAIFGFSTGLFADEWPRFRGPNGTGSVNDPHLATSWGSGDIVHRVAVPGRGNSSPIVVRGKLYLQSAGDDGHGRMLFCYDAESLELKWTAKVHGAPSRTHPKNSLASNTPAADDRQVVSLFWDGESLHLYSFDHQGNELWHVPLGSFVSQHGAGHSPILHEGRVFVNLDQDGKAELLCFEAATGKKLWSAARRAFRACYSTPFVRADGRHVELIVASTAGITAYDPVSGTVRWNWDWTFEGKPLRNVGSPLAGPGLVLAVSGDGDGSRHLVAVAPPTGTSSPQLLWEKKRGTPYVPCPLIHGEYIYWVNDNGFAGCVKARTGETVYEERITAGVTASPVLLNGYIVAVDERGNVFSYPAEPTFSRPRRLALGEAVYASPAVANGRLYIRGEKHIYVIATKGNRSGAGQ
jgi:outer membrane protein assembly factor BamB